MEAPKITAARVCRLLASGLTIKEACARLGIARWEVTYCLDRAKAKAGLKTTYQLLYVLTREGLRSEGLGRRNRAEYMREWRRQRQEGIHGTNNGAAATQFHS